jgi:hypothetical protein
MQANQFDLKNTHLKVSYSSSSFAGTPQLTCQLDGQSHNFSGNQIQQVQNQIGTLASVTLAYIPDFGTTVLTLLVPAVNADLGGKVKISTEAIVTTIHTSIGGPGLVKGAIQTYKAYALKGTAQVVEF